MNRPRVRPLFEECTNHPGRLARARGLCASCYQRVWRHEKRPPRYIALARDAQTASERHEATVGAIVAELLELRVRIDRLLRRVEQIGDESES
jgi:hypothetical protein